MTNVRRVPPEDIARSFLSEWFASIGHDVTLPKPTEFHFVRVKLCGRRHLETRSRGFKK